MASPDWRSVPDCAGVHVTTLRTDSGDLRVEAHHGPLCLRFTIPGPLVPFLTWADNPTGAPDAAGAEQAA